MCGIPWWSSGLDSSLPLQGTWVWFPGQGTKILHATKYSQKQMEKLTQ